MNPIKIMLVEDNTLVAENNADCLKRLGYIVTSIIASGEESIKQAQIDQPDIVLMDVNLRDEMDGVEAAEQIYTRFEIPIVFLSAYSDDNLLKRVRQVGSFGYLIKPFEERELYAMLEMTIYKVNAEKQRQQMDALLIQAQNMETIGTVVGGLAHDFNNLLYVIMGNINLAEDSLPYTARAFEYLSEAQNACLRTKDLITKLLTFSKGGAPVKELTSISVLVKDTVITTLSSDVVNVEFFIFQNVRQVEVDINQIKQVVQNLVVNAKEAMHNKGVLKVYCENFDVPKKGFLILSQGKYIKISFEDHGCGISKQNLSKIFDPYFSTKEMGTIKGQGLGLALCHSIITRHSGMIAVESEEGAGSTFSVYLPASVSLKEPKFEKIKNETSSQKPVRQLVSEKTKILLMDDEEMIRTFMERLLHKSGYDVETCTEGKEAVEIYKKAMESDNPFDLIILDLTNQFGMGGQEAMKRILELDPHAKGIVFSGYAENSVVNNFEKYGFSGGLTKPAPREKLIKVIEKVVTQ